ncbi:hypothetical protein JCM6882_001141 [Rhodosporidiobolus microsporus]
MMSGSRRSEQRDSGADEALLKRASMVEVTQEDKQNGYDTSLLSLQPRNSAATGDTASSSRPSTRPSTSHTLYTLPSFHLANYPSNEAEEETLHSEGEDEASPLSASFINHPSPSSSSSNLTHSHVRRPSVTSIPSISTPNPRFAAQGYMQRAQAAEMRSQSELRSQSRFSKYTSRDSTSVYSRPSEDLGEKEKAMGFAPGVVLAKLSGGRGGGSGGGGGRAEKKPMWQRKGLLVALAALVLVVCAALGIGFGVGISRLHNSNKTSSANGADEASSSSSAASSSSDPGLNPATSSAAAATASSSDLAAQPATSAWTDPAAATMTTDWAGDAATAAATTDWAAQQTGWSDPAAAGGTATGGWTDGSQGGGWWDGEGVWHSA